MAKKPISDWARRLNDDGTYRWMVIGEDDYGQFWWFEGISTNVPHGPFRTEEEAEADFDA